MECEQETRQFEDSRGPASITSLSLALISPPTDRTQHVVSCKLRTRLWLGALELTRFPGSQAPERRTYEPATPEDLPVPNIPLEGPFITTAEPYPSPPASTVGEPAPGGGDEAALGGGSEGSSLPPVELILGEEQIADGTAWNEARIKRRLEGEYERAGKQLHELVSTR